MFGTKSKGLFLDVVGDYALVARTSGTKTPFLIEELQEVDLSDAASAPATLRNLLGVRGAGYATACCSVYPASRIVARVPIEGRKLRDDGYLSSQIAETLKIDPAGYRLMPLSPVDGSDAMVAAKTSITDVLVCGAASEELAAAQARLLELGVYPERMELGTVAAIGGVASLLRFTGVKAPTLLLEIGHEHTQVFVVTRDGVDITRSVAFGISSMIPIVQKELGLKDEDSARKLFFSNSFDFTGMGPQLTKRLLRELQASIGFYEVQTGQSITQICCTLLPSKVSWLQKTLADVLGMKVLQPDFEPWLKSMGIELSPGVLTSGDTGSMWTSLFCVMGEYEKREDEAAA
jgi:hypothetical protein